MRTIAISLCMAAMVAPCAADAQHTRQEQPNGASDAYEFPLQPGMPEWKDLKSHAEMLAVCQIPDELLANMSTEGLVKTCLNYPMAYDAFAYDSLRQGLKAVISNFNGLGELLTRPNARGLLLRAYQGIDPANPPDCGYADKRICRFQIMYVELLLAEDAIIAGMDTSERRSLLEESHRVVVSKMADGTYGLFSIEPTAFLMSKILLTEDFKPYRKTVEENAELKTFVGGEALRNGDTLKLIVEAVEEFLETPSKKTRGEEKGGMSN